MSESDWKSADFSSKNIRFSFTESRLQYSICLHSSETNTAFDKLCSSSRVRDLTETYPPSPGRPPPARTEVEECRTDSKAAEGEHHFHHGHQDERHPQNDCGPLLDKTDDGT